MGQGIPFLREELSLLHETLSYASKRTFSESEKVRLKDLLGRIEERLLEKHDPPRPFPVAPPEAAAFHGAADTFCEALQRPFAAEKSQAKARRVRELVGRFHTPTGFVSRLRRMFGRS